MKAILSKAVGGPASLVFEEVDPPLVGPNQVLIGIKACGVNYPDLLMIQDKYQVRPTRPFSPGGEVSGVIMGLGLGSTGFELGDRVLATSGIGGMAEQIAVATTRVTRIPDSMPFDEAAAFMITYGTSYFALKNRAHVRSGESLLVLGASGGVGLAAVELGQVMGARVVAACSSNEKLALARKYGASGGIVYPAGHLDKQGQIALAQEFREAVGPDGVDVIYDAVGGEYTEPAFRALAWNGRYLVVGFAAGDIPKLSLNLPLLKGADILGVFYGAWLARNPETSLQNNKELFDLYLNGDIRPSISERYSLCDAARALSELAARRVLGKVVVTME